MNPKDAFDIAGSMGTVVKCFMKPDLDKLPQVKRRWEGSLWSSLRISRDGLQLVPVKHLDEPHLLRQALWSSFRDRERIRMDKIRIDKMDKPQEVGCGAMSHRGLDEKGSGATRGTGVTA